MRQNGERVHGPYLHRNRWRVVRTGGARGRENVSFATEAEARRYKRAIQKEIEGRTVNEAVQDHLVAMRDRGLRRSTVARAETHLRRFFQLDGEEGGEVMRFAIGGGLLEELRPRRCEELYAKMIKEVSVDTHRNALATAKTFGAWCVKQGWIRESPMANVEPVGQRNRGKKQLRIDEARKFVDLAIKKADAGDDASVGVLTALLLGLRASEVTDRVVRDLDDGGRLLWIEFGKTKRARRTLEVPPMLRPYLLALVKGRAPEEQLISRTPLRTGKKADRYWLLRHMRRLCDEAEIPMVCVHSLRGLHATLATEAGATSHAVAGALGHSTPAVTHAHYIDSSAKRRASSKRVVSVLTPAAREHRPRRSAKQPAALPEVAAVLSTIPSASHETTGLVGNGEQP
jgi:integrase